MRAALSFIDEFVEKELSNGYNTMVGEKGGGLSGGQKQRLALAQALYMKKPILIVDEGTSALDATNESKVMSTITSLTRKKTIIMVTHNMENVKFCDKIFVLQDGELVAQGSYDVVSKSGSFKSLISQDQKR